MEYERKGVGITWQIENAKYIRRKNLELYSPVITVDVMDGTKWKLGLHRKDNSTISLTVNREAEDNGPEIFGLDYEFFVHPLHTASLNPKVASSWKFRKGTSSDKVEVDKFEAYDQKTHVNPDTITIGCTMYRPQGSVSKSSHIFARTLMKTERRIFVAEVQNFKGLSLMKDKIVKTIWSTSKEKLMTVNLLLYEGAISRHDATKINITFNLKDKQTELFFNFKLFILDSSGNKTDIGKFDDDIALKSAVMFDLPGVNREDLLEKAAQYLPNDTLFLHCEITFSFEIDSEKVERTEYETDFAAEVKQTDFSKALEFDMSKMGILCDTKLQTATETFPANTAILSAESPVFEAMFRTDMKETIQKCVHIDDVDAITVYRMLVFLYAKTLEKLEWKDAQKLFFAADKYQLLSLKRKCARFLKESIGLSNCCVLLLLAYMHQNKVLKRAVQDYIIEYYEQVLYSDQWKDLEKNHPQLTIETFRDLFMKSMEV